MSTNLSSKALLATLRISTWTGRKLDRQATSTVETSFKTQSDVGNYTKKLLPQAKELQEVTRLAGALRVFFYEQTLPWCADGSRILSSKNYIDFTNAFRVKRGQYENAVKAFLQEYPNLRDNARAKLGDLFIENEYPTVAYLEGAFDCEISFMPLPDIGDFRTEILDEHSEAFVKKMRDIEHAATKDCWNRLFDVVSKAAVRLQNPESIVRDSLLENISEICALLPKLNISDNPELEAARLAVEQAISGISTEAVRNSPQSRSQAAKQLDDITSKMSAFMGV